jgi:hypothetical protein
LATLAKLLGQPPGQSAGNPRQPSGQRFGLPNASGLLGQYQKRSLKGILGIRRYGQLPQTDAQDHRPMPSNQNGEGLSLLLHQKLLQQLGIGSRFQALARLQAPHQGTQARHNFLPQK